MLSTRTASGKKAGREQSRVGLALAGGGPLGGIYEIGALLALDDALQGVDFNDLDVYVGVSSGSLMAACLANGLSPADLYRIYIENASAEHSITPDIFQMPAFGEYYQRAAAIPELLFGALWRYVQNPLERGLWGSLQSLGRAIPTGVFDSAPMGRVLTKLFTTDGRTNDFRKLKHPLYVVATDLDSGESVEFGAKGFDHVPIAQAVQASTALPGLYPPTRIDGRDFVDGALKKTLHASVALKEGANLVFCVNPLVPFDATLAKSRGKPKHEKLVEGGLPVVLSQTFRAMIHSRMQVGMAKYDTAYKNADVLLFEPNPDDAEMFFANVFSYGNRRRVCDHAYQHTIKELVRRDAELAPIFARHGIELRADIVRQQPPHIKASPSLRDASGQNTTARLHSSLQHLGEWLQARRQEASRGRVA
jgi:predicted acylesterase/phospholipase RssA